jgi:hypothetical protein
MRLQACSSVHVFAARCIAGHHKLQMPDQDTHRLHDARTTMVLTQHDLLFVEGIDLPPLPFLLLDKPTDH